MCVRVRFVLAAFDSSLCKLKSKLVDKFASHLLVGIMGQACFVYELLPDHQLSREETDEIIRLVT